LSQPAASRQIQALEAELGVLLFDRIGRRLLLTSEGEDIVRRGRRLLQEADSLRDRADALKGGLTGTLRVGASPQNIETILAPFVTRFRRKHSGIEVHFVEDGGARISDWLAQSDAQIVLTSVGNALFFSRLLYPAYALAVVAPSHPLGRRDSVDVSELADEPLLLLHRGFGSRGWFDAACQNADVRPLIVLESAAPHTLMALAANGEGAWRLSRRMSAFREGASRQCQLPIGAHPSDAGSWSPGTEDGSFHPSPRTSSMS
jgi:LysR family cyn operon transcriptional activator